MGRVVHFEISADNPDRAAEFYRKAFGWKIEDIGGPFKYLLAETGPSDEIGINGAIMERNDTKQATVNTIAVDKWEDAAQAIKDAGGEVTMEKTEIAGVGWFGYCKDTEGNFLGILESLPMPAPTDAAEQRA